MSSPGPNKQQRHEPPDEEDEGSKTITISLQQFEEMQQELLQRRQESLQQQQELLQQQQLRQLAEQQQLEFQQRMEHQQQEQLEFQQQQQQLSQGTYYTTISDLWENHSLTSSFSEEQHRQFREMLQRTNHPQKCRHANNQRQIVHIDAYGLSMEHLEDSNFIAKCSQPRSSHQSSNVKLAIWPVDIYGRQSTAHVAHLVPAAATNADTWWFILPWIFGEKSTEIWHNWEVCQKAIHGVASSSSTQEGSNRKAHTGIKHLVTNKIRLPGQGDFLDANPCLVIVPILTCQQVKDWKGEGYCAIVIPGPYKDMNIEVVTRGAELNLKNELAIESEIETSRQLLCHFLKAILCAHQHRKPSIPEPKAYDRVSLLFPSTCVLDPTKVHVTKVTFVGGEHDSPRQHPAPDPILLAARAAVTFARRHTVVLAAAAEPVDLEEDDENWTELDQLAAEQYLAQRAEALRPSSDWATLAKSLGQPLTETPTTTTT